MRQLKIVKSITNREARSFEVYLQEIGREPLVSVKEEVALAKKIRDGDDVALNQLVRANLRFVVSVAKQYQNQGLSLPDLINEGNLGLIKAAKRFDETRGFKFISYAVWWIRQSILQALAEQARIVRLPLNQLGFKNKMKRALLDLEQKLEREPSDDEIAEVLDTTRDAISDTMRVSIKHTSLDAPLSDHEESTLYDLIQNQDSPSPMNQLDIESLKEEIERCLSVLSHREKDVIKMYFGFTEGGYSMSLIEIGEEFNLTRERVRQIKDVAIRRLKHSRGSRLLKKFLSP
jgi:RNA polymerase primary sigma factor